MILINRLLDDSLFQYGSMKRGRWHWLSVPSEGLGLRVRHHCGLGRVSEGAQHLRPAHGPDRRLVLVLVHELLRLL